MSWVCRLQTDTTETLLPSNPKTIARSEGKAQRIIDNRKL